MLTWGVGSSAFLAPCHPLRRSSPSSPQQRPRSGHDLRLRPPRATSPLPYELPSPPPTSSAQPPARLRRPPTRRHRRARPPPTAAAPRRPDLPSLPPLLGGVFVPTPPPKSSPRSRPTVTSPPTPFPPKAEVARHVLCFPSSSSSLRRGILQLKRD